MGRMKMRQGVSVDLGLRRNRPKPSVSRARFFGKSTDSPITPSWTTGLWATLLAMVRTPLSAANRRFQNYRGRV